MTAARLRIVFLIDAVFSAGAAWLFLSGSWDGLYDTLDLPQGKPAVFVQCGGAVLAGVAYLLWLASRTPALMLPVARSSAIMNSLSAAAIVAWFFHGLPENVGTQGEIELAVAAALMAAFALLYFVAGLRRGGYGPEAPPPP